MRKLARILIAVVLLSGGLALARPGAGGHPAQAQIVPNQIPTLPPFGNSPSPSPSPSDDEEPGGGEDEDPGDDDGKPGDKDPRDGKGDDKKKGQKGKDGRKGKGKDGKGKNKKRGKPTDVFNRIPGAYNTDLLLAVATELRSLGWTSHEVVSKVFPPFIIAGEASWIDTWGAPRYGPGPIVRTHEGQDVFCRYGDPLLASVEGVIDFDGGGLGGRVARLHTGGGAYWYYAHLSDWNTEQFSTGDVVEPGDVIGYCGNSGNALTTPPHVHFGWYQPNGKAKNPMRTLIRWLHEAEDNALALVIEATGKRVKQIERLTVERRFGDAFTPDTAALPGVSGESLWASGSYPATGAFALAEVAVQAALAEGFVDPAAAVALDQALLSEEGADATSLDPDSKLARLLSDAAILSESSD